MRLNRERVLNEDPGRIDPEITLDKRVNLLPYYDPKWEFPRDRIIFGLPILFIFRVTKHLSNSLKQESSWV